MESGACAFSRMSDGRREEKKEDARRRRFVKEREKEGKEVEEEVEEGERSGKEGGGGETSGEEEEGGRPRFGSSFFTSEASFSALREMSFASTEGISKREE